MEPLEIINKYYQPGSQLHEILLIHSQLVTQKALWLAKKVAHLSPDVQFIREAAMLHDIGIIHTNAPGIACFGDAPYIQHGIIGREILEKEGLPKHALVCERHTGVGISRTDIAAKNLPLPDRDLLPVSIEEQIICLADKFYSKTPAKLRNEKSLAKVRNSIAKHGESKLQTLNNWLIFFGVEDS